MKRICLILAGISLIALLGIAGDCDSGRITFAQTVIRGLISVLMLSGSVTIAQRIERREKNR